MGLFKNNFRFWRERRLARCEARGASARAPGASPPVGCDRRATKRMARRRPAPEGWGCLAVWRCCSLLTDRWRVCSSLAPSQTAKQPPAKSEFIFEQTLTTYQSTEWITGQSRKSRTTVGIHHFGRRASSTFCSATFLLPIHRQSCHCWHCLRAAKHLLETALSLQVCSSFATQIRPL